MVDFAAAGLLAILPFVLAGFLVQLADGALGMAFGVISSSLLLSLGVPPAAASAGVHVAEAFTSAVSGLSHVAHRNIDWPLFRRLVVPGVIGGVLGAGLVSSLDAGAARPLVLVYLVAIGAHLVWRGLCRPAERRRPKLVAPLGLAGGFLDAAGGGGWGPVVTGNLLVQGAEPRTTIGTVIAAEFFLTLSISVTFIAALGWEVFTLATIGLLIGGVGAAPLGAIIARKAQPKPLLVAVGALLMLISLDGLLRQLAA